MAYLARKMVKYRELMNRDVDKMKIFGKNVLADGVPLLKRRQIDIKMEQSLKAERLNCLLKARCVTGFHPQIPVILSEVICPKINLAK